MRITGFILVVFLSLPGLSSRAAEKAVQPPAASSAPLANVNASLLSNADLYEGMVTNQTVTRNGDDFYRFFVASWRDQPLADRYTVNLREQPSARFGSQVHIFYGTRKIFQGQLPPNRAHIKALSESAAAISYKAVTEQELQRLLFRDPDLGQEEL